MPTFQPGMRVLARVVNKRHLWRPAKIVQPDPDQSPDIVTISYVGKTDRVKLSVNDIKLQLESPARPPTLDISNGTEKPTGSGSPAKIPPLPCFSDPWNADEQAKLTSSHPHSDQGQVPNFQFPGSQSNSTNGQPRHADNPGQSAYGTPRQSSRDWLLARNQPERDYKASNAPSVLRNDPPNRQMQVISDPSSPPPQPYNYQGDKPKSSAREFSHHPRVSEQSQHYYQPVHDEAFGRSYQTTDVQNFQFTAIRSNLQAPMRDSHPSLYPGTPHGPERAKSAMSRFSSADTNYSNTKELNLGVNSFPSAPRSLGSYPPMLSFPVRNRLIPLDHERHPSRGVDEDLRIPRATGSYRDVKRIPRHPQNSFDDSVPIPRNTTSTYYPTATSYQDEAEPDRNAYMFPSPKRQRIRYDLLTQDQLPGFVRPESSSYQPSRRLAKRDKETGVAQQEWSVKADSKSLHYQRPLSHEKAVLSVAPDFDSCAALGRSFGSPSEEDDKVLERIFADLVMDTDDSASAVGDPIPPVYNNNNSKSTLSVRGGGRTKGLPKRWRRNHREDALEESNPRAHSFESNIARLSVRGDGFVPSQDCLSDHGHRTEQNADRRPIPKVYGCICQDVGDAQPLAHDERPSVQCSMCKLWSHTACTGLDMGEFKHSEEGGIESAKGAYVCTRCLDEFVTLGSANAALQYRISKPGASWVSSAHDISVVLPDLGIVQTDKSVLSHLEGKPSMRCQPWFRKPLAQEEVSARISNLEQFREGIANGSAGERERLLFDALLQERSCKVENSDRGHN